LSFAPQGLKQALITGGIPPIGGGCPADSVYKAAFEQAIHQNEKYYKRFPGDIKIIQELVNYLAEKDGGGVMTCLTIFFLLNKKKMSYFLSNPYFLLSLRRWPFPLGAS